MANLRKRGDSGADYYDEDTTENLWTTPGKPVGLPDPGPVPGATPPYLPPEKTTPAAPSTRQYVEDYYKSRNTTPLPTSIDYWVNKIDNGGDANYYKNERLPYADEFVGGPQNSPYYEGPKPGGGNTYNISYGGFQGPPAPKSFEEIQAQLAKLFPDGAFNQDVVNRRTENASEALGRNLKSRNATNRSILAERGLIGSGPEQTAQNRAEQDIADQYANAVSGIYADESQAADSRMMDALRLAAGLSSDEAQFAVNSYNAGTNRGLGLGNLALGNRNADITQMLGLGNLALGNQNSANNYNLGMAQFGLDRDKYLNDSSNSDLDRYIQLLDLYLRGAGQAAGGYRGK